MEKQKSAMQTELAVNPFAGLATGLMEGVRHGEGIGFLIIGFVVVYAGLLLNKRVG